MMHMKKTLRIGIGKFSKSIIFNPKNYGSIGGDHDSNYFIALAQIFPNVEFYLLSKSDIRRLDKDWRAKNIPANIIDVWESPIPGIEVWEHPYEYLKRKQIRLDYCLILSGPTPNSSIPNYSLGIIDPTKYNTPIQMGINYVAPIVYFLNTTKTPYAEIGEDPRYIPSNGQDIIHKATRYLTTRNVSKDSEENKENHTVKAIKEPYTAERVYFNFDLENFKVDKFFLMNEDFEKLLKEPGKRTDRMAIYSNGLSTNRGIKKYPIMKEYFIDNLPKEDWICYGRWNDEDLEDQNSKDKFKDVAMIDLVDQMYNCRYTFMIAIKTGWPSSKLYKMLTFGIIPFVHKDWDSDRMISDLPEYLRVSSAKELKEKMDELDSNPEKYLEIWTQCQAMLKRDYYTGKAFAQDFIKLIHKEVGDYTQFDFSTSKIEIKNSCIFPIEVKKKETKKALF